MKHLGKIKTALVLVQVANLKYIIFIDLTWDVFESSYNMNDKRKNA